MKAKGNIIKALNPKWTILFVLITLTSLMSSCVEGDLYDLYDEDCELNLLISRRKNTKDVNNDIQDNMYGHEVNNDYIQT